MADMTKRASEPPGEEGPAAAPEPDAPMAAFPMHEFIGRQLKAKFDEIVTEPVPDRFRELLDQLERKPPKS
jgi:hypothetical protein